MKERPFLCLGAFALAVPSAPHFLAWVWPSLAPSHCSSGRPFWIPQLKGTVPLLLVTHSCLHPLFYLCQVPLPT